MSAALRRETLQVGRHRIEYVVKDRGGPRTLYLHGLGSEASETRPFAAGVAGSSVLVNLPSHGGSDDAADGVDLDELVEIAGAVAERTGVDQAMGVSLGCAVLTRAAVSGLPLRRAVLYLPAALGAPRDTTRLRAALAGSDDDLTAYCAAELPPQVRRSRLAQDWIARRSARLRRAGVDQYVRLLAAEAPLPAGSSMPQGLELLVLGAEGDPMHAADVVRSAPRLLPGARIHVYAQPAPLWTARADLRARLRDFLGPSIPSPGER